MSQLVSRGRRKAPVKKMRSRWTTIEATNSSAAQWCSCRMNRPPRTSKDSVQRRVVGRRHLHAAQRRVRAVVDDLAHGGVEEERQVGARQQQDEERVERDLTEQERPVVGVDLVHGPPQPRRRRCIRSSTSSAALPSLVVGAPGAVAVRAIRCAPGSSRWGLRPQCSRCARRRSPRRRHRWAAAGAARVAGPKTGLAPCVTSNCDWWQGQRIRLVSCS